MKKRGFTLIELLVVIAIIAILAAILFPVFMSAKEKSRQAVCVSNMKQLANAYEMYSQAYDGRCEIYLYGGWPPKATWVDLLNPYTRTGNIAQCPSLRERNLPVNIYPTIGYGYNYATLGYPGDLSNYSGYMGYNGVADNSSIKHPTKTVVIMDAWQPWIEMPDTLLTAQSLVMNAYTYIDCRHNMGANVLMFDSHVKWMSADDIIKHSSTKPSGNYGRGLVKNGGPDDWFDRE